jgi:hypothetical protein
MIKNFLVSILLLSLVNVFAQEGTSSPYSYYGIGDIKFRGTVDTRAMGGVSVFPDSIHLNLQNPASYSSLRYIAFTIGGNHHNTTFRTNSDKENARRSALDYIALGIPMGKFGATIGLMPLSSVGYKINSASPDNTFRRQFMGEGGVNKAFVGFGYQITKKLSVGADINFNFGFIKTENSLFSSQTFFGTGEKNTSSISGINMKIGAMYNTPLTKKLQLYASATFVPQSSITALNTRSIGLIQFSDQDFIPVDAGIDVAVPNNTINLPSNYNVAIGIGEAKKWALGIDFTRQQFANYSNRFKDIVSGGFENANRIAVGGYYIPKYNSFNSYFDRVNYRAGFRFENTGLVIKNESITDVAITAGLGLPVGGMLSNINLGIEYGQRGTKAQNLILENYLNFTIALSLTDKWFVKRKYD